MGLLAEIGWGGFVVAGAFALMLVGTVVGFYTRTGSGIDEHPSSTETSAPGARAPGSPGDPGRTPEGKEREGPFTGHGTR